MCLALEHPQLVDRLVVADVSPAPSPGNTGETLDLIQAMRSLDLSSVANRREADSIMQRRVAVSVILYPQHTRLSIRVIVQNLQATFRSQAFLSHFSLCYSSIIMQTSFFLPPKSIMSSIL